MEITRSALAQMIDHTLLKPDATHGQVSALIAEARELGTYSVCVSPSMLPLTDDLGEVKVATVCGFPSGNHTPEAKAFEAAQASKNGADEVDMVINVGLLKEGRADLTEAEIRAVREATTGVLKVIIESAALTDDEIVAACKAAEAAGADFVKTSTGFSPAGGASVHAVELMNETVGGRLGIKASGGIRDYATANAMIEAGATRLGLSSSSAVLDGADGVEVEAEGDY
ncbi:deoxyribose-phosphate aldolase [Tessaracoccus flavescens]|uniref:Deoxyribose-phosphate aldolase n=1 Tax=Tessaracoccus flavescens TaxID=399497 RepID=A0A1Q2CWB3_9ACTN|nr:deoxyribose-phosphate aldolase [Tessaracoccus flavescens]AQP50397.1 deoxyribose-phosphate aldolase [Tessaracoccus flavescens]